MSHDAVEHQTRQLTLEVCLIVCILAFFWGRGGEGLLNGIGFCNPVEHPQTI